MAESTRISQLSALSDPNNQDVLIINDVSDDTQSAEGSTKRITVSDLMSLSVDARVTQSQNNWDTTYTTTNQNSANWDTAYTTVTGLTGTQSTSYTDSDVDAHLNTSGASSGQVLSYTSGDYAWVDQSSGSGSGTSSSASTDSGTTYTNVTGVSSYNSNNSRYDCQWNLDLSENNKRYNLVMAPGLLDDNNLKKFKINFQNIPESGVTELRVNINRNIYDQFSDGNARFLNWSGDYWSVYDDGADQNSTGQITRTCRNIPNLHPAHTTTTTWTVHGVDLFIQYTYLYGYFYINSSFPSDYVSTVTDANGIKWWIADENYVMSEYESSYYAVSSPTSTTQDQTQYNPLYQYVDGNSVAMGSFGGVFDAAGGGNATQISTTSEYVRDIETDSDGYATRFTIRVPRLSLHAEGFGNMGSSDRYDNLGTYGPS